MMEFDTRPVSNREKVTFSCSKCGACCKNVRESILLDPYDAFRLVRFMDHTASSASAQAILEQNAELVSLSRGFNVFVLKTAGDNGACTFLHENRCSIYPVRTRACRLYPFAMDPDKGGIQHFLLCLEQPHHFKNGRVTAREWQRKNLTAEEKEFLLEETQQLPALGALMRAIPDSRLPAAEVITVAMLYFAYDYDKAFLPQYRDNLQFLAARLKSLTY